MNQKRKSPAAVKVIACLLLLGSLACLLLPWIKLSADTRGGRMNPGELLQSYAGLDEELLMEQIQAELSGYGAPLQADTVRSLLSRFLDGHFSLPDFALFCRELSEILDGVNEQETARSVSTASLAIWILVGLLAALGLLALCCQLTDHRWGILPYLLLGILVAAALFFLRVQANRYLREEGYAMLNEMGIGVLISYLGIDIEFVKMGFAAYLCPFLALLALLLMGIRKKATEPEASPYPARRAPQAPSPRPVPRPAAGPTRSGWSCPNCGRVCSPERSSCDLCGTERPRGPAAVFCPDCGRRLPRNASFCTECGAPIPTVEGTTDRGFDLSGEDRF